MSFLRRFLKKKTKSGKIVYGLDSQIVGEISAILNEGSPAIQAYEITTKDSGMKLSFPTAQFFIDESGRIILLPEWCYHVRVSCSKLSELERRHLELSNLRETLEPETFRGHMIEILKSSIPCEEEITRHLTKFEELLIELAKQKTQITDETTRLMTRRLLEYGQEADKATSARLDRKQYSLKIIELRKEYANISQLMHFVSDLYEDTKASSRFFEKLLDVFNREKEGVEEIGDLGKRAQDIRNREDEVMGILDNLIESLTT